VKPRKTEKTRSPLQEEERSNKKKAEELEDTSDKDEDTLDAKEINQGKN